MMKRLVQLAIVGYGIAALLALAWGWTGVSDGAFPSISYTEPSTNTDGSALTDLAQICGYWTADLTSPTEQRTCWGVSSPNGGQNMVQTQLKAPILPGQKDTFRIALTARDVDGNEGPRTATASLLIDRTVAQIPVITSPIITLTSTGPTVATYIMTWTSTPPAAPYSWFAGRNDGGGNTNGTSSATSASFSIPYPANGLAATGYGCVLGANMPQGSQSCNALQIPAKPVTPVTFTLTTAVGGTGSGTVSPGGTFPSGQVVAVTQQASAGSTFTGWLGDCTGTTACSVTMNANKAVTAVFTLTPPPPQTFTLVTSISGSGSGSINPPVGGTYNVGQVVNVTATPNASSTFTGWSGACTGTGACAVTMDANKSVTAIFTLKPSPVTAAVTEAVSCKYTIAVSVPSGTTSVTLFKDGVQDGSPDKNQPFKLTRTYSPGTYALSVSYVLNGVNQPQTPIGNVTCP